MDVLLTGYLFNGNGQINSHPTAFIYLSSRMPWGYLNNEKRKGQLLECILLNIIKTHTREDQEG